MSPNAGGRGGGGGDRGVSVNEYSHYSARIYRPSFGLVFAKTGSINSGKAVHMEPKKLWRSNSLFNLFWILPSVGFEEKAGIGED